METFQIKIPRGIPSFRQSTEIDGTIYQLSFIYNNLSDLWVMNIADAEENPIASGIPLLLGMPLTLQTKNRPGMPRGEFILVDETGQNRPPTFNNLDNISLVYLSYEES